MTQPPRRLILVGLMLATFLAYVPALGNDFINMDDPLYVTQNEHVRTGISGPNLVWAWTSLDQGFWQPVLRMSLQLDATLFGAAWGFHLTNVLFHVACVGLLFVWLDKATGALERSAIVAGLFGLHPLHVESVAWVTERKDVLSTFFLLLALLAYGRHVASPSWRRYALVAVWFFLGLATKPMVVTLPVLLLLIDWWPTERSKSVRKAWLLAEKVPLLVLALVFVALTLLAHEHTVAVEDYPLEQRLANIGYSWGWYVQKTLWPTGLMAFYPRGAWPLFSMTVLLKVALLAVVLGSLMVFGKAAGRLGVLWFVITLLPVGGFLSVGSPIARADRFMYVPHIGLFIAIVWTVADLWNLSPSPPGTPEREGRGEGGENPSQRMEVVASAAPSPPTPLPRSTGGEGSKNRIASRLIVSGVMIVCGALTWRQVQVWRNDLTLWNSALEIDPTHFWAHHELGKFWHDRFLHSRDPGDLQRAREHLEHELRLTEGKNNDRVFVSLAVIYLDVGDTKKARHFLDRALAVAPTNQTVLHMYGDALVREKRLEEAADYLRRAWHADPRNVDAARDLATTLRKLAQERKGDEAMALCAEVRRIVGSFTGEQRVRFDDLARSPCP